MSELTLPAWAALSAAVLLVCAGFLTLVGSMGLLRMPSFYSRMHPVTMGTTLGAGCALIASMVVTSALVKRPVIHELLITFCILVTAPVSAMTLMRAAIHRGGRAGARAPVPQSQER